MPELPEIQALAERLGARLAGAELERVAVLQFSAVRTVEPAVDSLAGASLEGVGRRGKFLVFDLRGPRLLVHLGQGGRVELEESARTSRPRGAVARIVAGGAGILVREYGTRRRAGLWVLAPGDEGPLGGLGPEPSDPEFARYLREASDPRRLNTVLRDQRTVAGIGRGYADDILHEARLSPFSSLNRLDPAARERLVGAVAAVLGRALAAERRRTGGLPARLGDRFAVHGRAGRPCARCGDTLRRVSYEEHEIAYCPGCQTGGRVLADRRLSRLLR